AIEHSGLCRTGSYGVDAHAEARGLERRGLRHAFDGVLAGSVDGCAGRSFMTIGRGDVDDAAAPLSLHHAQLMLHAEQRPEHIGVEGGGIGVGGLLRHRTGLAFGAGVVDGRVEPTKARDGPIDQAPHLVLLTHIRAEEFDVSAERAQLSRDSWPAVSWRPATTIRLPSRAKASAAARPIPVSAPVIKTTGVPISLLLPL